MFTQEKVLSRADQFEVSFAMFIFSYACTSWYPNLIEQLKERLHLGQICIYGSVMELFVKIINAVKPFTILSMFLFALTEAPH